MAVFSWVTGSLLLHTPGVFGQRWRIQRQWVSSGYIDGLLSYAPPPIQPWLVKLAGKLGCK